MKFKRTYGVIVSFLLIASFLFTSMGNISIYATADESSTHFDSDDEEKKDDFSDDENNLGDENNSGDENNNEDIDPDSDKGPEENMGGDYSEEESDASDEENEEPEEEVLSLLQGVLLDSLEPEIIKVYIADDFYDAVRDISEGGIIELYDNIEISGIGTRIDKSLTIRSGTGSPVTIKCAIDNSIIDRATLHIGSSMGDFSDITLNLQDVIFEGTFDGTINNSIVGGLYIRNNTKVKIEGNGKFINNGSNYSYSGYKGGAIAVGENSTLEVGGTTYFENNYSLWGGAIYGDEGSTVIIRDNVIFKKNIGDNTGAIYMPKGSKALKISGNVQFLENEGMTDGGGGAIFTHSDVTEISGNVVFNGNSCEGVGAIYGGGEHIEISGNVQFLNNRGNTTSVGAVYFRGGTALITDKVLFDNNSANKAGAIMGLTGANIEIDSTVRFTNNRADEDGGAIYLGGSSSVELKGEVYFENNSAVDGGAVFATEGSDITIGENVSFVKNLAETGGAIQCKNESTINISGFVTFTENQAEKFGGAISRYSAIDAPMIIDGEKIVFYKNTAGESGGAIHLEYTDAEIRGLCQFTENKATSRGGAVFADYESYVWLEDGVEFIKNSSFSGGALCGYDGTQYYIKDDVVFTENHAENFGGAIEIDFESYLGLSGKVQFEKNETTGDFGIGGAIYVNDFSELDIQEDVVFLENKSKHSGGAVYTIERTKSAVGGNVLFEGNRSGMDGGAFVVSHGSKLEVEGAVRFIGNHAENHGGAIDTGYESSFDSDVKSYISLEENVQFLNNYAQNDGGAIYEYETASIDIAGNVLFSDNSTDGSGGAVYSRYDTELTVDGTVKFTNNKAINAQGGAIYTGDYYHLYVGSEVQFNNNDASYLALDIPAGDKAIHEQKIFATQFTNGTKYGYNNVDINAVKDRYYTVDFDTDGGAPVPRQQFHKAGEFVNSVSEPYKESYRFIGWFTEKGVSWNFFADTVQGNMTLFAKWEYDSTKPGEEDRERDRDRDRDKGGSGNNSNNGNKNNPSRESDTGTENYLSSGEEIDFIGTEAPANIAPHISDSEISRDNTENEIPDLSEKISEEALEHGEDEKSNPITGMAFWYLPALAVIILAIAVCNLLLRKRQIYK